MFRQNQIDPILAEIKYELQIAILEIRCVFYACMHVGSVIGHHNLHNGFSYSCFFPNKT